MKVNNGCAGEVLVGRDSSGALIELQTAVGEDTGRHQCVLLTPEEARRLAAIILFEAGKLDAPLTDWLPADHRRSA